MSKGRSAPSFRVGGFSSLRKGDARVSESGFGNEGEGGSPNGFPFRIALHEEVASTNDEVKRALEAGEPEGLVVRALRQVSGYGRQGRSWTSPEGGLYCSLLLRPQVVPPELPTLSLVVGMAVRRALVALAGARAEEAVRIKWPNDVVLAQNTHCARFFEATEIHDLGFSESEKKLGQKNRAQRLFCANEGDAYIARDGRAVDFAKLCGISLEAHGGGVCVGVGVNVLPPDERPDVGGKNRPAYVADLVGSIAAPGIAVEVVLEAFLAAFAPLYGAWRCNGFAPFADEFNAYSSLNGQNVRMVDHTGNLLAEGAVAGVDAQGRLVLRSEFGIETAISSGEAHLV